MERYGLQQHGCNKPNAYVCAGSDLRGRAAGGDETPRRSLNDKGTADKKFESCKMELLGSGVRDVLLCGVDKSFKITILPLFPRRVAGHQRVWHGHRRRTRKFTAR